jgi:hypothetical protein
VLGTGRCGSTLLSRMIAHHPGVASIFEWFPGFDPNFRFRSGDVSGGLLAKHLLRDHPVSTAVLARGHAIPEMVYPYGEPGMRYKKPGDRVPWNLSIAMPRLSDQPDVLFDALIDQVRAQPDQPLGKHYRHVFDWLAEELGRTAWVERSAGSIEYVAELDACFPEARYVHLHRDGRECALSMREYPALRVAVALMFGLIGEVDFTYEGLTEMVENDPERIDTLLEKRPPLELYGQYWTNQVEAGLEALRMIDPARVLTIRFEEMAADPLPTLRRIEEFFALEGGDGWVERGAALVRGVPTRRFLGLDANERATLQEACAPGMRSLGQEYPA